MVEQIAVCIAGCGLRRIDPAKDQKPRREACCKPARAIVGIELVHLRAQQLRRCHRAGNEDQTQGGG